MKKIFSLFALSSLFALPAVSLAAPYHYINLNGEVVTIEASNAAEAMAISEARGDVLHSGVAIDQGFLEKGNLHGITYQYQSTLGGIRYVTAASMDAAHILAPDIISGTLQAVAVFTGV